jgi:hypothetical protein
MPKANTPEPKKRVIIDYKNVTQEILGLFAKRYPYGYDDTDVIKFKNAKGEMVKAVPFETKEAKYLVKVSVEMDRHIDAFLEDDDQDDIGSDDISELPDEDED